MKWLLVATTLFFGTWIVMNPGPVHAESTSANFVLWGQAFTGGGARMTSSNFTSQSSLGDLAGDPSASANFYSTNGLQAIYEDPVFTFSLSPPTVTLSPASLSTGAVSTGSITATVSTNADFGYVLAVHSLTPFQNVSGHQLLGVVDGSVTVGAEEFGMSVSGADAAFATDEPITASPLVIASRNIFDANRVTTATFKAAISSTTDSGFYSGTFSFIATGRY